MSDLLEELPTLAVRVKEFVRGNPTGEHSVSIGPSRPERMKICAVLAALRFVDAAKASRYPMDFPVDNDTLTLAQVKSYENTINLLPIERFPGIGTGLLRITGFAMRVPFSMTLPVTPVMHALVEFSPLGWPELPDMVSADFNTLFVKPETPSGSSGRREFF